MMSDMAVSSQGLAPREVIELLSVSAAASVCHFFATVLSRHRPQCTHLKRTCDTTPGQYGSKNRWDSSINTLEEDSRYSPSACNLPEIVLNSSAVRPVLQLHHYVSTLAKLSVKDALGSKAVRAM